MKRVKIQDETYFNSIYLVFDFTIDQANRLIRKHAPEPYEWNQDGSLLEHGDTFYVLVQFGQFDVPTMSVLSHELLHLTFRVMRRAGMEYNPGSEEAYTYFMQRMFTQCSRAIRRHAERKARQ